MRSSYLVVLIIIAEGGVVFIWKSSFVLISYLSLLQFSLVVFSIFWIVLFSYHLGLSLLRRQTLILVLIMVIGLGCFLSELSLQLFYLIFCFLQLILKLLIFVQVIILSLDVLRSFDLRWQFLLTLLSPQLHHLLMVIRLIFSIHSS